MDYGLHTNEHKIESLDTELESSTKYSAKVRFRGRRVADGSYLCPPTRRRQRKMCALNLYPEKLGSCEENGE